MDKNIGTKRVFFAFEAASPWPKVLPGGRLVDPTSRHLTIVFLGDIHYPDLEKILHTFPKPKIKVGLTGKFDRCLFLPSKRPNVVAWHVHWFDEGYDIGGYQKEIADWLKSHHFSVRLNPQGFLPHVTLSRRPFKYHEWREAFQVLPVVVKNIHLYESVGGLRYIPLWSHHLLSPFDISRTESEFGIEVRGESLTQLYTHLLTAVAFYYPQILLSFGEKITLANFSELTSQVDQILEKSGKKKPLPFQDMVSIEEPHQDEEGVFTWKVRIPIT